MKLIQIEALLMDNNEIMFNGRSLWFLRKKNGSTVANDDKDFITVVQDYDE